jgi:peptide/nickel transport system substrate-binding protein
MIRPGRAARRVTYISAAALLMTTPACTNTEPPLVSQPTEVALHIGFGLTTGQSLDAGMRETARGIAVEGLMIPANDGRPQPRLAAAFGLSDDGLDVTIRLRPAAEFHDGSLVSAETVRDLLLKNLPAYLGPAYADVERIEAAGPHELTIRLKRPSRFFMEGLDMPIQKPGDTPIGTGPFSFVRLSDRVELRAYDRYYGGRPVIDHITFQSYASVRSAWAEMLRGRVDMLFDVGVDALDSLTTSSEVEVFPFLRPYAFLAIVNVNSPHLRNPEIRRALNAAIDRQAIVSQALRGNGAPADGAVWPEHWAYDSSLPRFAYDPRPIADLKSPLRIRCLFSDPTHERIALVLQQQLQAVGVHIALEARPVDEALAQVRAGDFDLFLADATHGPTMIRPYFFWQSDSPFNWGNYRSPAVDLSFDQMSHARNDDDYRAGVTAFQRAIVENPPAIFLAWSQRARAVSRRFHVPGQPGDILRTLRLWRPSTDNETASSN